MISVRSIKSILVTAGIVLFLCTSAAFAENRAGAVTVNPFFGKVLFDHDLNYHNDIIVGLGLGYNLTRDLAAELSYGRVDTEREEAAGRVDGDVGLYRLEALYHLSSLLSNKSLVPYLALGAGMMSFDSKPVGSGRDNDVAADYGIGLKYFVNPDVALRGDVRHIVNFKGEDDFASHNLLYTVGFAFLFGGEGKAVAAPAKAAEPEKAIAPVKPAEPAQVQKAAPADSDGDGVINSNDKCPDSPRGTAVDKDGCPVDSDGDGIADYLDKCPGTQKGTKVDANGCPVSEKAKMTERGTYDFGIIYFDTGKSTIKAKSRPVLAGVVEYLKKNPEVKLEVQGYTDSVGSETSNQKLSDARANAVRTYIIGKGIAADRLTAKGYGESSPAASNDTKEGRDQNRRIEFKPIQ